MMIKMCSRHSVAMEELDCSKCNGDGTIVAEDDLTSEEFIDRCYICSGSGMGGWYCDLCEDEQNEAWERK